MATRRITSNHHGSRNRVVDNESIMKTPEQQVEEFRVKSISMQESYGLPVTPDYYDDEMCDFLTQALKEAEERGFKEGMKYREFLICPCGCTMRIDAKDYQEHHSEEALNQKNI